MGFKTRKAGSFYSPANYREEARAQLNGHWKEAIMLSVVPAVIFMVFGLTIVYSVYSDYNMGTLAVQANPSNHTIIIQSGADLLSSMLALSISFSMLRFVRNIQSQFDWRKDLLYIFRLPFFWKLLGLEIVKSVFIFLWTLLFVIPGFIKMYSYSQASYIMYDHLIENDGTELSITEAITASRQMMKGRKMQKFMLDFSFIGWMFVSVFTFGLGFVILQPYMLMAEVIFYEDLRIQTRTLSNQELHELYQKQQILKDEEIIGEDADDFSDF